MTNAVILSILLFAPAVIALAYAAYSMVRFIVSRRRASLKNELAVGALGVFALFAPRLLMPDSKKYFTRFVIAASFFCLYVSALVLIVGAI